MIENLHPVKSNNSKSNKTYHLEMDIRMKGKSTNGEENFEKIKVLSNSRLRIYESSKFSTYSDLSQVYFVDHMSKSIFISKSNSNLKNFDQSEMIQSIQDSLVKYSDVSQCSKYKVQNKVIQYIKLQPNPTYAQAKHIESVEYFWNTSEKKLDRINMNYQIGHDIEYMYTNYLVVDFFSDIKLKNKASDYVFSGKGKVLPAFANYEIEYTE
ncbi:MAG: hypothetical protein H7329_00565 [Opitutaceae bacterium]|nr:hypothetical protein [Cytophagales bacterium]